MPSIQQKSSSKRSTKDLNQPEPHMRNYTSLVVDDSISFAAQVSPPQKTPNSQKNILPYRFPPKQLEKTPSTYHHSQSGKSATGSVREQIQKSRAFEANRESGQIYEEIIKILELENRNLKEQNKYMLGEHKKMVSENHKLKQEV